MKTRHFLPVLLSSFVMLLAACASTNATAPAPVANKGLTLSIFNAPQIPLKLPLPVPAPEGGWTWPPTSVTLIAGQRDAVLVDTLPTLEDSEKLADWIAASGKNLTTIYITHGHIDHFLGTAALLKRFPHAHVVATEATVRLIKAEAESGTERATYTPLFAKKIASTVVVPEVLSGNRLLLEGHELIAKQVGQSDVAESSYLYVPELSAVIVGDIAYNGVHPTLVGSTHQTRMEWIKTLSDLQALKPAIVIAAHRAPTAVNDSRALTDTISYLQDADRLLAKNPTSQQFTEQMFAAQPNRMNPTTLIYSAATLGLPQK
jgi:glyoxylase-like metal-dependent hydrolase (beta-lactamase superfamily II)